jgi:hypothetical protein
MGIGELLFYDQWLYHVCRVSSQTNCLLLYKILIRFASIHFFILVMYTHPPYVNIKTHFGVLNTLV